MSSTQTTHPFTCNTCQVAFRSSNLQRTHMQSDWHRYNLKRRVASLPPLSSEIFAEKVLASKADAAATAARASFEMACETCEKTYYSENALANHLGSQKHKANIARMQRAAKSKPGRDDEARSVMSSTFSLGEASAKTPADSTVDGEAEEEFSELVDGFKDAKLDENGDPVSRRGTRPHHSADGEDRPEHPLSPEDTKMEDVKITPDGRIVREDALRECLFCNTLSANLQSNFEHMQKTHSLFVPERNYLADAEGLMLYLNKKVHDHWQCLYCNRLKWSEDGIKTHMRDTDHCKIAYDTEQEQLEIGDFYDFRSTYSDDSDSDSDEDMSDGAAEGGGVKLSGQRVKIRGPTDEEDAGWETSSTVSSVPTEDLGPLLEDETEEDRAKRAERLRLHKHHSHSDNRKHRAADGWHSHAHNTAHAVYHDDYELHLPTGRVAGHRSMNRYYRQNLHNYLTPAERHQQMIEAAENSDAEEGPELSQEARERGRTRARPGAVERAIIPTRAEGGLGMIAVSDAQKRQVKALEKKQRMREGRMRDKMQWKTDRKGNFQKHFRDPLLQ